MRVPAPSATCAFETTESPRRLPELARVEETGTIGSCVGKPAIIKETVKSRERSAGGEQNRHGELDAKQSRPFKRLSGGSR